ncbi:methyltransferase domain-containing protein [Paenibacillus humicola]|uniref:methyltransferase domain-containing protein n=1 Tax=Paenibacillus humicola TaxID=3110540 RepID=UPI00237B82E7|nr:methyltransferase domain-containing protein [Paenibacillus humicola]
MTLYFATVLPGLEHVLCEEIRVKIPGAAIQDSERGKVSFSSGLPPRALTVLRSADNLYRTISRFRVGPHKIHLADLEREIYRSDKLEAAFSNRTGAVLFKVNASRTGHHTYSRFDAAEAAARGIARRDSRYVHTAEGGHETEFRLDILHGDAVFALRLTDASFRYRTAERRFTPAALRPTVAHALVWLSNPERADVFVDPCCGSGTIVSERTAYPYRHIQGGDAAAEAVDACAANIGSCAGVQIRRWDARRMPIDSGSVDKIVTNLPFGRQIAVEDGFYDAVVAEMKRVLNKEGRVFCLTDADAVLQRAAAQARMSCTKRVTLSLKGLHPSLYVLAKP